MRKVNLLYVIVLVIAFAFPMQHATLGAPAGLLREYDVTTALPAYMVNTNDLIRIKVSASSAQNLTATVDGNALKRIALIKDGQYYVAIFSAVSIGTSKVTIQYNEPGMTTPTQKVYSFEVVAPGVGKLLSYLFKSGQSATLGPEYDIRPGDVLRVFVAKPLEVSGAEEPPSGAMSKVQIVDEGTNIAVYYVAVKPGLATFTVTSGELGVIFTVTVN